MATFLLLSILYTQIGYQLSKKGWKTWKNKEQHSAASLLFFPVHHQLKRVGKNGFFATGKDDEIGYKVLMTLFWPLSFAWNAAALACFIGPDKVVTRLLKKKEPATLRRGRLARQDRLLEARINALEGGSLEERIARAEAEEKAAADAAEIEKAARKKRKAKSDKAGSGSVGKKRRSASADVRGLPPSPRSTPQLRVVADAGPGPANANAGEDPDEREDAPHLRSGTTR